MQVAATGRQVAVMMAILVLGGLSATLEAAPLLDVSRTLVRFHNADAHERLVQPVFLTNVGDAPLILTAFTLSGTNAAEFILGGTCGPPITLAAGGGRCRLELASDFLSAPFAGKSATLVITSNSAVDPGPISVTGTYSAGHQPILTPNWLDFAPQAVATSAPTQTFLFANPFQGAALLATKIALGGGNVGDFSVASDCNRVLIGGQCTITIGFVPAANGPRSTELEVDFTAADSPNTTRVTHYSITGVGGPGAPAFDAHQQGLTGSWYQAATSGQGVELEIFPDLIAAGTGLMQGSWFTFDSAASGGADHNRWYTFAGNVQSGSTTATVPIYLNTGGNFNAPPVTSASVVGSVTVTFADCANAQLAYTFTDGSNRSGNVALTRLTPNVTCTMAGGSAPSGEFGLSGNWYDATESGQGFVIEVNPAAAAVFLTWYTYAVNGVSQGAAGQRWYTALASYAPGSRSILLPLYETTGGLFNASPPVPTNAQVGTATLTFTSCAAARFAFNFTAGSNAGQSGSIDLTRVGPVPAGCVF